MAAPNPLPTFSSITEYIYWALDETSGTLSDSSGNGYHLDEVDWVNPRLSSIAGVVNTAIQTDSNLDQGTWLGAIGPETDPVVAPTCWMVEFYFKAPELDASDKSIGLSIIFSNQSFLGLNQIHVDSYKEDGISKVLIRRADWVWELTNDYAWHKVNVVSYDGIYEHLYIDNELVLEEQAPPSRIADYFIGGFGCRIVIDNTYIDGDYGKQLALDEIKLVTFEIAPVVLSRRINVGHYNANINLNPSATNDIGVGNIGEQNEPLP